MKEGPLRVPQKSEDSSALTGTMTTKGKQKPRQRPLHLHMQRDQYKLCFVTGQALSNDDSEPIPMSDLTTIHGLRNNRQGSIWPCKSQTDQRWNLDTIFFSLKPHLPLSRRPLFFCLHGLQWWLELSSWSLKTRSPWKRASDMVGFSSLGVLFPHQDLLPFIIYHFWRTCPHTTQSREEEQRPG